MMTIPWKDVQNDIKNTLSGYNCKVTKVELSENPNGSVFCDFRVAFKNPDDVADWDEVINLLERATNKTGTGQWTGMVSTSFSA
jgi:hypothetical protein